MSHNPNTIKSQDELNEGGRKSDVLIEAISKAERLQKQLDIAVKGLKEYADKNNWYHIRRDNSLDEYPLFVAQKFHKPNGFKTAEKSLKQIKELDK